MAPREHDRPLHPDVLDGSRPFLILAVVVAALVLSLFRAAAMPLTDPDEGRYAEIARHMAASGNWLVPRLFVLALCGLYLDVELVARDYDGALWVRPASPSHQALTHGSNK